MSQPEIRIVDPAEAPRAVSAQITAFASDPIMRWMWPEPHEYLRHFPAMVAAFGGRAFESGTAYTTADFRGGALWLPPGVTPDGDALERLFRDTTAETVRSDIFPILEQMGESHPHEPHWHLAFIGVDPTHRGRGTGAALLRSTLARIDEQGLHSYLESSNPANVTLYRRHGFEVVREIQVGGSPPVIPMLRKPGERRRRASC